MRISSIENGKNDNPSQRVNANSNPHHSSVFYPEKRNSCESPIARKVNGHHDGIASKNNIVRFMCQSPGNMMQGEKVS